MGVYFFLINPFWFNLRKVDVIVRSVHFEGKENNYEIKFKDIPFSLLSEFVDEINDQYCGNPFYNYFTVSACTFDSDTIVFKLNIDLKECIL